VARTRVSRLLEASPNRPAADLEAVCLVLVKVSQLIVDQPEIVEMDLNPLLADETGVIAAGSFMRVARFDGAEDRLAIRPYPQRLEERATLRDGREVVLRPIRPEDEPSHNDFVTRLSPEDSRFRFFHYVRSLPHSELARLTQIDYDREMAFIAAVPGEGGQPETVGVVRSVADPDNDTAEFSVVVRSDMKRLGIASLLLRKLLDYCRGRGTRLLTGDVLIDNLPMLELARRHGGAIVETSAEEGVVRVVFALQEPPPAPRAG
jgi:acetyltransferase